MAKPVPKEGRAVKSNIHSMNLNILALPRKSFESLLKSTTYPPPPLHTPKPQSKLCPIFSFPFFLFLLAQGQLATSTIPPGLLPPPPQIPGKAAHQGLDRW